MPAAEFSSMERPVSQQSGKLLVMTPSHPMPRPPATVLAVSALVAVMLVVPVSAPLCASALGVCAMPEAVAPPIDAHCPMAEAMGHGEAAAMECCVSDAAPQGPPPAVPGKADVERQLQSASLLALAPVAAVPDLAALPAAPAPPPPAADLAASAVPLYTLLSSLLS